MTVLWRTVEGNQAEKPAQLDITSSGIYVYMRQNIEQKTRTDEEGNVTKYWEYEEAKLTRREYEQYIEEINSPTYQAVEAAQEAADEANAALILQQLDYEESVDEALSEILITLMEG